MHSYDAICAKIKITICLYFIEIELFDPDAERAYFLMRLFILNNAIQKRDVFLLYSMTTRLWAIMNST